MTDGASDFYALFLLGILSAFVLVIASKRKFFSFPLALQTWPVPIHLIHVVGIFAIYFGVAFLIAPLLIGLLKHLFVPTQFFELASWLNFLNSSLIFSLIALYVSLLPSPLRKGLWQRQPHPILSNISFALLAWFISFPLVLFCSQLLDWFVNVVFHAPIVPEQLAVHFLKMTFGHPFYFFLAITTIILFAPLIEETLFRAFLQTFIRQHLGAKQAIAITSFLFAFFHYSPEQGLGNIPIVGSLFILALFLGFIYEKQGSLLSPITLHASFNLISVLNLYFLGGFPSSPI